jgi:hypothetical protein
MATESEAWTTLEPRTSAAPCVGRSPASRSRQAIARFAMGSTHRRGPPDTPGARATAAGISRRTAIGADNIDPVR